MAFTYDNAISQTRYRIQDAAAHTGAHTLLSDPDLESAIRAALADFSHDMARELVAEFAGDGGNYYVLTTVLASWREKWSSIRSIQYNAPVIADDDTPAFLEAELDWTIEEALLSSVRTLYLYFPNHTPLATETVRVAYTGFHTLDGLDSATATTIWASFEEPFYDLCAGLALQRASNKLAQSGDSTFNTDSNNYQMAARQLMANADRFLQRYRMAIGVELSDGTPPAADAFLDWDTGAVFGGDRLFHRVRIR